jgi:CheY-like chemotaxis protein
MADETILVIDADQETDQRIVSTLEADGYLVFSGVSHLVTDEMVGKLKPSLIYIKPLSPNAAGFQPCRTIHTIPKLQNLPIVLLASLKGRVEPQYTEYYGIVDFLKPNFTSEELIAKTISVLASAKPPAEPEIETFLQDEEAAAIEEPLAIEEPMVLNEPSADEELLVRNEPPAAGEPLSMSKPPAAEKPKALKESPAAQEAPKKKTVETTRAEEAEFSWEDEAPKPAPQRQPLPKITYRQSRVRKPSLLPWLIGLLVVVALGGGGFFAYQHFMPIQKPVVREAKKAALPAAAEQKNAGNTPSGSPVTAAPASVPGVIAPAQAPSAGQPAPEVRKPVYAVQVGAFKTEEIAAILVKKLQGKGYEASAQKGVTKDNSPIIRVLIGNFSDRKAAMKLAGEVQEKEQIKTTIFTN